MFGIRAAGKRAAVNENGAESWGRRILAPHRGRVSNFGGLPAAGDQSYSPTGSWAYGHRRVILAKPNPDRTTVTVARSAQDLAG